MIFLSSFLRILDLSYFIFVPIFLQPMPWCCRASTRENTETCIPLLKKDDFFFWIVSHLPSWRWRSDRRPQAEYFWGKNKTIGCSHNCWCHFGERESKHFGSCCFWKRTADCPPRIWNQKLANFIEDLGLLSWTKMVSRWNNHPANICWELCSGLLHYLCFIRNRTCEVVATWAEYRLFLISWIYHRVIATCNKLLVGMAHLFTGLRQRLAWLKYRLCLSLWRGWQALCETSVHFGGFFSDL